ncbi:MAG TPA: hypothetical protein VJ910_01505 [Desulfuromonadales bacterium]|nr:hypothetical protein [Desulfuromonadales bacterium]
MRNRLETISVAKALQILQQIKGGRIDRQRQKRDDGYADHR